MGILVLFGLSLVIGGCVSISWAVRQVAKERYKRKRKREDGF